MNYEQFLVIYSYFRDIICLNLLYSDGTPAIQCFTLITLNIHLFLHAQGISGWIVNILGGVSMDYSG